MSNTFVNPVIIRKFNTWKHYVHIFCRTEYVAQKDEHDTDLNNYKVIQIIGNSRSNFKYQKSWYQTLPTF